MSGWLFAGLALATLAVLAALQFLRARPEKVRVITSMFWKDSARQVQARTLFGAFQNPLTYLLLAAASILTLLALADPISGSTNDGNRRVIALEAGLAMTANDNRFEKARELVWAEARGLSEQNIAVIVADPYPRVLKHFDESLGMLEGRLDNIKPTDTPVSRDKLLNVSNSLLTDNENNQIVLVAAQPAKSDNDRVRILAAGEQTKNAFILSTTFIPSAEDANRGELQYQVGFTGELPTTFTASVKNGDQVLSQESFEILPGATKTISSADLVADGSVVSVIVSGADQITADNQVEFRLPNHPTIRLVPVDGFELPPVLASIINSLPSVSTNDEANTNQTTIRVGPAGSGADIQIHSNENTTDLSSVVASNQALVNGLEFEDALSKAPQGGIPSPEGSLTLLTADGLVLASIDPKNNQLNIADTLFDDQSSVVKRTGYFVFWSNLIHHLAGWSDEPLTLTPEQGSHLSTTDSSPTVMKASFGNFSLSPEGEDNEQTGLSSSPDSRTPAWQWLLLGALILMLLEAVLHIRRKIT